MYFPYCVFNYPLRRKSDTEKQETKLARHPKLEDVTGNAKYTVFETTFCSSSEKTIEDGFFSGVATRKYRKVSETDRCRLVEAYNNDKDVYALAKDLGINRDTVYRLIKRYIKTGEIKAASSGGRRFEKVTEDMKKKLEELVEEKNDFTLQELAEKLYSLGFPKVH